MALRATFSMGYTEQKRLSLNQASAGCITTTAAELRKVKLSLGLPERDPQA
jgi:hypothetical protein